CTRTHLVVAHGAGRLRRAATTRTAATGFYRVVAAARQRAEIAPVAGGKRSRDALAPRVWPEGRHPEGREGLDGREHSGLCWFALAPLPEFPDTPHDERQDQPPRNHVRQRRDRGGDAFGEVAAEPGSRFRDRAPERPVLVRADGDVEDLRFDALHQVCLLAGETLDLALYLRQLVVELDQRVDVIAATAQSLEPGAIVGQHRQLLGRVFDGAGEIFRRRRQARDLALAGQDRDQLFDSCRFRAE